MQPTMPLLRAPGQAEAAASLQPIGRLEATAAYVPVRHVLLTAGGTLCPKLGTNNFLVSRQYEVGGGSYLPLGTSWLLNGLGGYGQAVNNRGYHDLSFILSSTYSEYKARYDKLFAQVGLAKRFAGTSIGCTYRLTRVRFSMLEDVSLGPLPLSKMLRHEALFFVRYGRDDSSRSRWEALATMGLSVSGTPRLDDSQGYPTYGAAEYQANRNLLPAFYASLGIVYRPYWQQGATVPK